MGTISKRPSGRYQAQTISYDKRITKTFPRLAGAKRWISQIEADNDAGLPPESRLTVGEQLVKYRTLVSERRIHWRHECAVIGCFLDDPISELTISCVSPRDVESWIKRRRTIPSRSTGRLFEESTIARQLQTLSAFISWVVKQNLLKENPCLKVSKPSSSVARERVATDEEIERLKLVAGCYQ
ncbi:MAG: hypothetical protein J6K46_04000 [Sutterella sp.]|nr:hypothetical protein [Sutterella sp.]